MISKCKDLLGGCYAVAKALWVGAARLFWGLLQYAVSWLFWVVSKWLIVRVFWVVAVQLLSSW